MIEPSAAQRETARRMLGIEGCAEHGAGAAAAKVHARIGDRLSPLIGVAGVHSLFARCLRQPTPALQCLAAGDLAAAPPSELGARMRARMEELEPAAAAAAAEDLFASFLALLATLIGDRLTAQILENAWPGTREPGSREEK